MPIAEISQPLPLVPEGEALWRLMEVREVEPSDNAKAKYGKSDPRWRWEFEAQSSNVCDETGKPWKLVLWTNNRYGNAKAGLTRIYNMIVPKCTPEIAAKLDPDVELVGKWFEINVKHIKKEDGELKSDYLWIKPYRKAKAQAAPEPPPADDDEPEDGPPPRAAKAGNPF